MSADGANRRPAGLYLLEASAEVAGHLAVAVQQHRRWAQQVGLAVPRELTDIERSLAISARRGQRGTPLEDLWSVRHADQVSPLLVTYADAAALLGIGERTVKRLVAAGDLQPVHLGGAARLRISDITSYVDHLANQTDTKDS